MRIYVGNQEEKKLAEELVRSFYHVVNIKAEIILETKQEEEHKCLKQHNR